MRYKIQYVVRRLFLILIGLPFIFGIGFYFYSDKDEIFRKWEDFNAPTTSRKLPAHLELSMPDSFPTLKKDGNFNRAFFYQSMYLLRPQTPDQPTRGISKKELLRTLHTVQDWEHFDAKTLAEQFDFYRVKTKIKDDKVRITGYYTPVIPVRSKRTPTYYIPFLQYPKGFSDSAFVAQKSLQTGEYNYRDISLAWTDSKKRLKNAQLQGSAFVRYASGEKAYLGYHSEVSLSHPDFSKYVFFQKLDTTVLGAGGFPLTADYSVAVDTRYIPLGACLLAELPILDKNGNVTSYTHRILFAQDTGGAIKTTDKLDLYCGIGKEGLAATETHNQYCKLWLLLAK